MADGDASKKIAAGILGILIGALGIHKFILGYTKEGVIMLLVTVLTLGFGGFVMGLIGLIEGILYLTKSDEEFVSTYVTGRKGWFRVLLIRTQSHPNQESLRLFAMQVFFYCHGDGFKTLAFRRNL